MANELVRVFMHRCPVLGHIGAAQLPVIAPAVLVVILLQLKRLGACGSVGKPKCRALCSSEASVSQMPNCSG